MPFTGAWAWSRPSMPNAAWTSWELTSPWKRDSTTPNSEWFPSRFRPIDDSSGPVGLRIDWVVEYGIIAVAALTSASMATYLAQFTKHMAD